MKYSTIKSKKKFYFTHLERAIDRESDGKINEISHKEFSNND